MKRMRQVLQNALLLLATLAAGCTIESKLSTETVVPPAPPMQQAGMVPTSVVDLREADVEQSLLKLYRKIDRRWFLRQTQVLRPVRGWMPWYLDHNLMLPSSSVGIAHTGAPGSVQVDYRLTLWYWRAAPAESIRIVHLYSPSLDGPSMAQPGQGELAAGVLAEAGGSAQRSWNYILVPKPGYNSFGARAYCRTELSMQCIWVVVDISPQPTKREAVELLREVVRSLRPVDLDTPVAIGTTNEACSNRDDK